MAFKSFNEIVEALKRSFAEKRPTFDTKENTVIRDLFIDIPADQMAQLYTYMLNISNLQSVLFVTGSDLDKLAANYGIYREGSVAASGDILVTKSSFTTGEEVDITDGTTVATAGAQPVNFITIGDMILKETDKNLYRGIATRYKSQLQDAGISDEYAQIVYIKAVTEGVSGNVGPRSIIRHTISGINHVINLASTAYGQDAENDDDLRTRVLLALSGNNMGTADGYKSTALLNTSVIDALVVSAGNRLMVRDRGQGGAVDVWIYGEDLATGQDTIVFTYQDANRHIYDPLNDILLGQVGTLPLLHKCGSCIHYRMIDSSMQCDLFDNNILPDNTPITALTGCNLWRRAINLGAGVPHQPVDTIVSVAGPDSSSGSNFTQGYIFYTGNRSDTLGQTLSAAVDPFSLEVPVISGYSGELRGNYVLRKDIDRGTTSTDFLVRWIASNTSLGASPYANSPYGFDSLHWLTNSIEYLETKIKGITGGVDPFQYSDVTNVASVIENVSILDESPIFNASVTFGIYTRHTPISDVTRIYNVTTGETYAMNTFNPTTGAIVFAGVIAPIATDVLQVDYIWNCKYSTLNDYSLGLDAINWGKTKDGRSTTTALELLPTTNVSVTMTLTVQPSVPTYLEMTVVGGTGGATGTIQFTGTLAQSIINQPLTPLVGSWTVTITAPTDYNLTPDSIDWSKYTLGAPLFSVTAPNAKIGTVVRIYNSTQAETYCLTACTILNNAVKINSVYNTHTPTLGDTLHIDYVWLTPGTSETVVFSTSGTQFSNNRYQAIATLTLANLANETPKPSVQVLSHNQPVDGTSYDATYSYTGPKDNETITVSYLYNKVVTDVTNSIEAKRNITADVLVRSARKVLIDVNATFKTLPNYVAGTVQTNTTTAVSAFLTATALGGEIDVSDISAVIHGVAGVNSVDVTLFRRSTTTDELIELVTLNDNEYAAAGNLIILPKA